ncbi:MAG: carbohydrate ABC transporter permease [Oscillospiraceae bacterium]
MKKITKRRKRLSAFDIFLYVFFGILACLTIYPFYNAIIISLTNTVSYIKNAPYLLPYTVDFSAYKEIMNDKFFFSSFMVTVFITVVGTFFSMIFSISTAYVLSRKNLPGRKFFLSFILFTMLFSGGMVPTYIVVSKLGFLDNVWAMIIPCMLSTYYIMIMKNYFQSLPVSLEEAAKIDGANDFQVLIKIYLPISKPFMATFTLFYAVERWNEWWNAHLYIIDKNLKPLQTYLREILATYNSQLAPQLQSLEESKMKIFPQAIHMATIIITMIPILCFYPFLQKYFVKGVMIGSVKE